MRATLLAKTGFTDKGEYALEEGKTYLVGRSRDADVIVKDKLASRNHCKITATGAEEWTVADLGSSNGTYVNRQRITTRALRHGDTVQVGKAALEFRVLSATTAPTVIRGQEFGEAPARPSGGAVPSQAPPPLPYKPTERMPARPAPPPATPPPLPLKAAQEQPAPKPPRPAAWQPAPAKAAPAPQVPPAAPSKAAPMLQKPTTAPAKAAAPERPQAPLPSSQPKPREGVEEDVRGLFEFLDKVGKGSHVIKEEPVPVLEVDEASPPKLRDGKMPSLKLEKGTDGGALFSLLDKVASQEPLQKKAEPPPRPAPAPPAGQPAQAPPKPGEEGGLLAFLRKKKQQP